MKMKFLLLSLISYLLSVVSGNRYLPRCSRENVLSITTITITGNISAARQVIPPVALPFLDFVMIQ